jgi:PAS domain S-box-containing protein
VTHLARELEQGAGLAIIAEEALATIDLTVLGGGSGPQNRRPAAAGHSGNVYFLERPFHATTLLSMVRSGLRARRRQYQARALLEDLRAGEERFRLFIEHAPAAIAMLDRELRYVAVSRRWMQDFKLSGVVVGRGHYEVFPEIPWHGGNRTSTASRAVEVSDGDRLERQDGSVVWIKREVRPWRDNRGDIGGLVISWEDITGEERRRGNSEIDDRRTAAPHEKSDCCHPVDRHV